MLLVIAHLLPGFEMAGLVPALIAVVVIGLMNAILGLVLSPLTVVSLGLFSLGINALLLKAAAGLLPGFSIRGLSPAPIAAILLALLRVVLTVAVAGNPAWV